MSVQSVILREKEEYILSYFLPSLIDWFDR